jgi:hypothetical protein
VRLRSVCFFWSCKLGKKTVRTGQRRFVGARPRARLVCKGRTQPAQRRVRLEVQRFAARGGWRRIGIVRTNNRGRFGFSRRLNTIGNWNIRVAYGGDARLAPSGSLSARVKVVRAPRRR